MSLDRGLANVIQHPPANTAGIVVIRLREQTLVRVRLAAVRLATLLSSAPVEKRLWVLDESQLRICPKSPG